ncbi:hypothetical protein EW026_g1842 [Hermanssonia centrifuga]|uniref:Uncharacterized protein n=1 Tax=Hermanssonia centrifuga TaxID=98765 RepID=A0A4S4KUL4_9APHY|nr:hypothetical protein EW026_g1842 [Hermanssonia centrifuga]
MDPGDLASQWYHFSGIASEKRSYYFPQSSLSVPRTAMGSLSQTVVPLNPPHIPGSIFSPGLTPPIISFPDQERRQSSYYKTATMHSAETSSLNLHASIRAERSREDLEAAGYEIPALTAKASFGDMRNVHYLIPDLPPLQKN